MHSRTFLRAGLVSLTFALCALFASAMPVPPCSEINPRSCLVSKPDPGVAISKHSGEDYNIVTRSSISHADHLALREVIVSRTSVKEKFKKFGQKLKAGFQKVGQGIKTAAKKVGRFVKTTGAKIVKFGAKVVSTGMSVLSKVAKVIPGVGKAISAGLKGVGTAADVVSNAIHANLGKKLDKGMKIMDKVQNPISKSRVS
ncbi:hypothetical protein BDQ17DRAFT_957139 [Cyathus striatus]|nr:hypothetical protein BDQ17DRAFT_957139 [Cyathus striatus]